jgi:hypothetical protein
LAYWGSQLEYGARFLKQPYALSEGAAVIVHGLTKRREVPAREIDLALRRKELFEHDPHQHTHAETT